jgi:hypothetical protein
VALLGRLGRAMVRDRVDYFLMFRDTLPTSFNNENMLSRLLLYLYETQVILLEASKEFQNSGGILVFGPNAFRVLEGYGVYAEFVEACSMKLEPSRLRRYNDSEIISETSPNVFEKLYGYRFADLRLERSGGHLLMGVRIDVYLLSDLLFFPSFSARL